MNQMLILDKSLILWNPRIIESCPSATLRVWQEALRQIQRKAADTGIASEFPDFMAGILKRAIAVGHGEEHVAASTR
jgi:hypothetical protein